MLSSKKSPHVFLSIENISNESLEKFIKEARRTRVIKKSRETNSSTASNHDFIKHLDHSLAYSTHRVLFLRLLDSPSTVKFFKSASLRHCRFLSSSNPSPSFVPPWSVSHDIYIYISREGGFGWWGMTSPRGGKAREGEAEGVGVAPG